MVNFLPPLESPWALSFYSFSGVFIYLTRKSFKKTWNVVMEEQYPVTVYEDEEAASKEELSTEIKRFIIFYLKKLIIILFIVFVDLLINLAFYFSMFISFAFIALLPAIIFPGLYVLNFFIFNVLCLITSFFLLLLKGDTFVNQEEAITNTEYSEERLKTYKSFRDGIFLTMFMGKLLDIESM